VPFDGAPMTTFRNGTHAALIAVLSSQRKALKLTTRQVAAQMPRHLGWDHTVVTKIEKGRRNISFVETRELAGVLELNISTIDLSIEALENANFKPAPDTRRPRKKK